MSAFRVSTLVAASLTLLLCGLAACSDGGGSSTAPPDDEPLSNLMAAGYGAVADAVAGTAGASAPVFQSLAYFAPHIRIALDLGTASGRAAETSCLPTASQGQVFAWDDQQQRFTPTPDPALGQRTRFLVYPVASGAGPVTSPVPIGHFELGCTGVLPSVVLNGVVNFDGVDVGEAELVTMFANLPTFVFAPSTLTLRSPSGDDEITFVATAEGKFEGTPSDYLDHAIELSHAFAAYDARLGNLHVTIGMEDTSLGSAGLPEPPIYVVASGAWQHDGTGQHNGEEQLIWNAGVTMSVPDESGILANIFGGSRAPLEFEYRGTPTYNGVLACFSGPYDAPDVAGSASEEGCAGGVITDPIPLTVPELAALQDGYAAMMQVLDVAAPMWIIAMALLTP